MRNACSPGRQRKTGFGAAIILHPRAQLRRLENISNWIIEGEISRDNPATTQLDGDADFLFFETLPGAPLRASIIDSETTWWPRFDPIIGLFDEDCNYIGDSIRAPDGYEEP